jgi:hypothetical protein
MPAESIIALIALLGLGFLAYGPWQWVCTDVGRQMIFEARDAIFDMAADGKLSFESHEYQTIRASLQRSIRFAHELTWPRFVVLYFVLRRSGRFQQKSAVRTALEGIHDEQTRREIEKLVTEAQRASFGMMLVKSPLLLVPFVVALALALLLHWVAKNTFGRVRTAVKPVEERIGEAIEMEAEHCEPDDFALAAAA